MAVSSDLADLSATQLAPLYRARAVSPVEVTQAVLARMARLEPLLCATWGDHAEAALAQAQASQARWAAGAPLGALDGVPVTLKEHIATQGVPQAQGCAATDLKPAKEDAPPAARLREAGAIFVARTTMPDWGVLSSSLSSFHRLTRNPWRLDRNPGGSSAGAGVAAAVGYGPLHVGTDIGGSIRLPASWCGVVGFKPSQGRVPVKPPHTGRVAGPLARTVADVAQAMAVLSLPDWRDATSLPPAALDWSAAQHPPEHLRGLRVGLWLEAGWGDALSPEVREAVSAVAQAFEAAGAVVEPVVAPVCRRSMVEGLDVFWRMRAWLDYAKLPPERQARVLPYLRAWLAPAQHATAAQVFHGQAQMAVLRDAAVAATRPFDYVVCPVSPDVAFPVHQASPLDDPERPFEHLAYTLPWNMSGQPAVALNAGWSAHGLPVGVQIVGRRHDDVGVLRMARLWECLRPAQRPWPQPDRA